MRVQLASALSVVLLLSACGGSGGDTSPDQTQTTEFVLFPEYVTPAGVVECSVDDIKRRVDHDMRDYYVYYDQVPELNLDDYETASDLIRALRVEPDTYSSVRDSATQSALYNVGEKASHGFWFGRAEDNVIRFRYVDVGSPAEAAGIQRGDELVSIEGRLADTVTNDEYKAFLLPENSPVAMTVRTGDEAARSVSVEHAVYRWTTAGPAGLFVNRNDSTIPKIGYLPIKSFLETTKAEIDASLAEIANLGGADELIVDLRYNGGGRTSVARYLGALVGGAAVEGKVITFTKWNDKYTSQDQAHYFEEVDKPLNMPRVIVLATQYTSSASEIFINSLKPYIEVVVVGGVTSGKPFTSNGKSYCGKTINAMRSVRTNSVGVSVSGGIPADCYVDDNWGTRLSSTNDPLISASLKFVLDGSCNLVASSPSVFSRNAANNAATNESGYMADDITRFVSDE